MVLDGNLQIFQVNLIPDYWNGFSICKILINWSVGSASQLFLMNEFPLLHRAEKVEDNAEFTWISYRLKFEIDC